MKTNLLFEIIESYRKSEDMSVDCLIDGITSHRSYYRYLNDDLAVPLDVLIELINKLNVSTLAFVKIYIGMATKTSSDASVFSSSMIDKPTVLADQVYQMIKDLTLDVFAFMGDHSKKLAFAERLQKKDALTTEDHLRIYHLYLSVLLLEYEHHKNQITDQQLEEKMEILYDPSYESYVKDNSLLIVILKYHLLTHKKLDFDKYLDYITQDYFLSEGTPGVIMPSIALLSMMSEKDIKLHFERYKAHVKFIEHFQDSIHTEIVYRHIYKHQMHLAFLEKNDKAFKSAMVKYISILRLSQNQQVVDTALLEIETSYGIDDISQIYLETITAYKL